MSEVMLSGAVLLAAALLLSQTPSSSEPVSDTGEIVDSFRIEK